MRILAYITGMNREKTFERKIRSSFLQQITFLIHLYLYSKGVLSAWTLLISYSDFKWKQQPLQILIWVSQYCLLLGNMCDKAQVRLLEKHVYSILQVLLSWFLCAWENIKCLDNECFMRYFLSQKHFRSRYSLFHVHVF